jgi:hypothetical protein
VQREDILERLRLTSMQVGCVVVDAEQRRRLKAIHAERRTGGSIVANLQRIVDVVLVVTGLRYPTFYDDYWNVKELTGGVAQ